VAGLSLASLLREFPDITLEKVELLTRSVQSKEKGVYSIPTLVSGDKKLSGFYLTKKSIREFLETL